MKFAIATAFALLSLQAADMPQAGQQATDFTLASQDGTPVSLHSLHG